VRDSFPAVRIVIHNIQAHRYSWSHHSRDDVAAR